MPYYKLRQESLNSAILHFKNRYLVIEKFHMRGYGHGKRRLILHINPLIFHRCIGNQFFFIKIFFVHIHPANLMIIVSIIIINSLVCIAAGSVQSNLILVFAELTAASLLIHTAKNVKKLAYAFLLRISGKRIHFYKSRTNKSGLGG